MISLFLDSSNVDLSIAIADDEHIIDEISYEAWQRQSELMIPELDKILTKNNVSRQDIKDVVVSIGPGSYTGVRIALTIAKVIAVALNVPVFAISSLHAMKDENKKSICLINARSARSYVGVYEGDKVIIPDGIMTNDEVKNYINEHPDYTLMGELNYLGLQGKQPNVLKGMFELKKNAQPVSNILGLTPVYLKD
ncbi:MAG: tRNA (adenosine(37)-N6)-threonylcarbamoyltransferase complex dimerization subunit type 1 TsaB [Bacilli bacterium]|nr:tRNA (adenosine(37)-N6)-threonylcarbamoyltransferase complex dimerization subunit type 1 TsaB [Bacilli bacterium]